MSTPSDSNWDSLREQIIGLGEHSARKSYFPELQRRIRELEETRGTLDTANRQLQALLDAASETAVIATDPDGLITVFNLGAEKMLGYCAEEIVGKETPMLFHLESEVAGRSRLLSSHLGHRVNGFHVFVENARLVGPDQNYWTYVGKSGKMLLVNLVVTAIHDEQGAVSGFLGIAEDVTHQKLLEYQILESEKLLTTIINSIPNPIYYKDINGVYLGCNEAFCTFLGIPRDRIIGLTVFDVTATNQAEQHRRFDRDLLEQCGSRTYETSIADAFDIHHDMIVYKSCLLNNDGGVSGLVGVMLDITERKRAESDIMQKEELFHLLFEKSGDANLLIDGDIIIDCNAATLKMLGYDGKHQVVSLHPGDISPEYQPDGQLSSVKAHEMIKEAYEQGSHRFEWLHKKSDGSALPVEVMLTAIPMNDRRIIHTAWRDLTDRNLAIAENERLTQNLLHAQKIESIGRLAGGVAHDFNNLLTPIIGYAEMLKKFCAVDQAATKRLGSILDAAGKARDLTRQLLAFGRKQLLEMKIVDLNQILEEFSLILERTIREDVHIELQLEPHLRPIMADVSQIEQVIMNLVVNAHDAMPGGGNLVIETSNRQLGSGSLPGSELPPGAYVCLSVSDSGSGMSEETKNRIFEPFFTTKELGKGTGLGLATVFGIVKQHGGTINVYSEMGHGSIFTLYFPGLSEGGSSVAAIVEEQEIFPVAHTVTILLAEDSLMVREMVAEMLVNRGYQVLVAETPDQACVMMEKQRDDIDLLLSDVIMPGMNGLALYNKLRLLRPDLKVLFMSGYSENIVTMQNMLADSSNYIQKPFSSQALLGRISEILRN